MMSKFIRHCATLVVTFLTLSFFPLPTAQAQSFLGVLAPQSSPVQISLSATSIRMNQSATATASGGSGDGAISFSTTTPAK